MTNYDFWRCLSPPPLLHIVQLHPISRPPLLPSSNILYTGIRTFEKNGSGVWLLERLKKRLGFSVSVLFVKKFGFRERGSIRIPNTIPLQFLYTEKWKQFQKTTLFKYKPNGIFWFIYTLRQSFPHFDKYPEGLLS